MFCVYAGTAPSKAREVLSIVRGELSDIAERGVSGDELERAKGHMKGALVLSLEDTAGRMARIGKSEISHGEILSVDELLDRVDSVTAEDAQHVARETFSRPMALTVVGPFRSNAFGRRDAAA
jgi:predicted Zn-dependent peptidase